MAVTRPARSIATALVGTILAALPVFLFGGLATLVRTDLGFGVQGIGLVVAAYFTVSSLASVPGGRIGERYGARRAILGGAAISAIALIAMGLAQGGLQLGAAIAVAGVGNAVIQPAANLLLTQHIASDRRGLAFGIKQSAIPGSALLGGLAVAAAGESLGWRGAFWAASALAVIVALITPGDVLRGGRRTDPGVPRHVHRISTSLVLLAAAAGFSTAAANSVASYLVEYGVWSGLTASQAGLVLAGGSALGIVSRVLMAWQADLRGGEQLRVVAVLMGGSGIGYLLLATAVTPGVLVLGTAVAFLTGWGWNALFIYSVVTLNPNTPAASTGVTQGGAYAGSVIGPAAFGYAVGAFGFQGAWMGLVVCSAAAASFIAAAQRSVRTEHGAGSAAPSR